MLDDEAQEDCPSQESADGRGRSPPSSYTSPKKTPSANQPPQLPQNHCLNRTSPSLLETSFVSLLNLEGTEVYDSNATVSISSSRNRALMTEGIMRTPTIRPLSIPPSSVPFMGKTSSRHSIGDAMTPIANAFLPHPNNKSGTSPTGTSLRTRSTTSDENYVFTDTRGVSSSANSKRNIDNEKYAAVDTTSHVAFPRTEETASAGISPHLDGNLDGSRNREFDVYSGSQHDVSRGNALFVLLIAKNFDNYQAATDNPKRRLAIVDSIIDDIDRRGGHFLKERPPARSSKSTMKGERKAESRQSIIESRSNTEANDVDGHNGWTVLTRPVTQKKVKDTFYRYLKKKRKNHPDAESSQGQHANPPNKKRPVSNDPVPAKKSPTVPPDPVGILRCSRTMIPRSTAIHGSPTIQVGAPAGEEIIAKSRGVRPSCDDDECPFPPYTGSAALPQENQFTVKTIQDDCTSAAAMTASPGTTLHAVTIPEVPNPVVGDFNLPTRDVGDCYEASWHPTPPHPPQRLISCSVGSLKWSPSEDSEADVASDSSIGSGSSQSKRAAVPAHDPAASNCDLPSTADWSDDDARSSVGSFISSRQDKGEKVMTMSTIMRTPHCVSSASATSFSRSNPTTSITTPPISPCYSLTRAMENAHHGSMGNVNHMGLPGGELLSPASRGILSLEVGSESPTVEEALDLALVVDSPGFSPIGWNIRTTARGNMNMACYYGKMASLTENSPTLGEFLSPRSAPEAPVDSASISYTGQPLSYHTPQERSVPRPRDGLAGSSLFWRLSHPLVCQQPYVDTVHRGTDRRTGLPLEIPSTMSTGEQEPTLDGSSCVANLMPRFAAQLTSPPA